MAIKAIDLKGNQDYLHNELIQEEIRTLERIRSSDPRNLLRLEGVILTKNNLYIVSEFCEGKDVGKLLRSKKQFTETEAQSIMKQFINGYQEIFKLGIVHRDLKPSNLFVKKGKIKIADFGFAIPVEKSNQVFIYNVGSPYYMPPETLKCNKYSYYSDLWAIGVIAYELVYGRCPWKEKVDAKLYDLILNNPIETLLTPDIQLSN